jgi:hypothetical protein
VSFFLVCAHPPAIAIAQDSGGGLSRICRATEIGQKILKSTWRCIKRGQKGQVGQRQPEKEQQKQEKGKWD